MSRFQKLSQTLWCCQYHIVWVPKYRFRILNGDVAREVANCIRAFSEQKKCKIIELNVQVDHVHLLVKVLEAADRFKAIPEDEIMKEDALNHGITPLFIEEEI